MQLLQLIYFQKVAQLQHMTHAAEDLHVAQPALSKTINNLESELGVKLFDRRGKYIELNSYGEAFLKSVNIILDTLNESVKTIQDMKGEVTGTVKLVVLSASKMLPGLLASFRKKYPQVQFRLLQHSSVSSYKADYDFCIYSTVPQENTPNSVLLMTEQIFLAVPKGHPFASRTNISLSEASEEQFVSLKPGSNLRNITDFYCSAAGFIPKVIFESDDPAMVRGLIYAGLGVAFIPEISWGGSTSPYMTMIKIIEPDCRRNLELSWSPDHYLSKCALLFRDFAIDFFAKCGPVSDE